MKRAIIARCGVPGCSFTWWGSLDRDHYVVITHHPDGIHHNAYTTRLEQITPRRTPTHQHAQRDDPGSLRAAARMLTHLENAWHDRPSTTHEAQPHGTTGTNEYANGQQFGSRSESPRARARRRFAEGWKDFWNEVWYTFDPAILLAVSVVLVIVLLVVVGVVDSWQCAQGIDIGLSMCAGTSSTGNR